MAEQNKSRTNLVPIRNLPLYVEPSKLSDYKYVEDQPILGQSFCRNIRYSYEDLRANVKKRLGLIDKSLKPVKETATKTEDYIRTEIDLFPKTVAITLGGMAGFIIGMRRQSMLRRYVYAIGGLLTMSAFCYPHETIKILRIGIAHAQRTWEDFQKSPEPKK